VQNIASKIRNEDNPGHSEHPFQPMNASPAGIDVGDDYSDREEGEDKLGGIRGDPEDGEGLVGMLGAGAKSSGEKQ